MTNIYTWTISALDCIPDVDGKLNYVVVSHWRCEGTDGTFVGSVYNTVSFPVNPDKKDYTPFADLTEAEVIQWTQDALGAEQVAAIYTSIDSQIENAKNPPIVSPALPWASSAANAA